MKVVNEVKRNPITITKVLVILFIFVTGLFGYEYYQELPARSFCENVPVSSNPAEVITLAKQQGLSAFDLIKENNKIVVLNHKGPYFRLACELTFKGGHIISRRLVSAD